MASLTTTVTYLELTAPDQLSGPALDDPRAALVEATVCTNSYYLYLYTEVGRAYHWVERRRWSPERLRATLDEPGRRIWTLVYDGSPAGYFELVADGEGGVEVAYFGLLPEFVGRGLGGRLLTEAVRAAWAYDPKPSRVWLHTCTLDAPAALPNYVARGFRPYKTEEEVIKTIDEPAG